MSSENRYQTETLRQRQAFVFYYELGPKRSYKKVADNQGVSVSTIKNWSRAFSWRLGVEALDSHETARLLRLSSLQAQEQPELLLKVVDAAEGYSLNCLADMKAGSTVRDLVKVIEARLDLEEQLVKDGDPEAALLSFGHILVDMDS